MATEIILAFVVGVVVGVVGLTVIAIIATRNE